MSNPLRNDRVSIVVPLEREAQLFEDTLLSVLENADEDCEVIAVHNGTYEDPFDLASELAIVTARSNSLVDLVRDAFDSTTAPLVHLVTSGMKVQAGWLHAAMDRFEDDSIGAIVPCQERTPVCAAGWEDTKSRLCQPVDTQAGPVDGFFLGGVVLRRQLLGELLDAVAPALNDPIAVAYAFSGLVRRSGWKIQAAKGFSLQMENAFVSEDVSDFARGQTLASIAAHLFSAARVPSFGASLKDVFLGESSFGETLGMRKYRDNLAAIRRSIDPACVSTADDVARRARLQRFEADTPLRRAA
ncbi:hypothetical protein LOC67_26675 [Stieleria sp. JC731]|uniref:hypothetical protein n=1 Tax=Pirellulaceae TaxID=2691357 RepID=UPI001E61015B|nr:hypothetical protein [Stieleria sp. JC731]MCC9604154.1 hypothetical protein [Stieleria sp. JC731]